MKVRLLGVLLLGIAALALFAHRELRRGSCCKCSPGPDPGAVLGPGALYLATGRAPGEEAPQLVGAARSHGCHGVYSVDVILEGLAPITTYREHLLGRAVEVWAVDASAHATFVGTLAIVDGVGVVAIPRARERERSVDAGGT